MHELPVPPSAAEVERYRQVVIAGHRGDTDTIDSHRNDQSPMVRQAALSALVRVQHCTLDDLSEAFGDPSPHVRSRAAELSVGIDGADPTRLLGDDDARVVEVASFACGEVEWGDDAPVAQLAEIATTHDDALCRESAAAALGAIGDPAGLDAILIACTDRVTVRRRAMLALAAFDDPRADDMLRSALDDKDWQVRQAAEDLLEVGRTLDAPPDPDAYAD